MTAFDAALTLLHGYMPNVVSSRSTIPLPLFPPLFPAHVTDPGPPN